MKSVALVADHLGRTSANPMLARLAKNYLLKQLERIQTGHLVLREGDEQWQFGEPSDNKQAAVEVEILDSRFYWCILSAGETGAGESYMQGYWRCARLAELISLILRNQSVLNNLDTKFSLPKKSWHSVLDLGRQNNKRGSKRNILAHYDLNNAFFSLFLDPWMMYSSAIYPREDSVLNDAAEYKLRYICERLDLRADDHLLEIGSGWGGLAIYAARHYGCRVTTTTISDEQYRYAERRIGEQGLQDRITLLKQDYRELQGQFDKLVSVEMIEAVGHAFYASFFKTCSRLLKPTGLALIQAILTGDQRFHAEKNRSDFIRRYIFPGGCLPSHQIISTHLARDTDMQCVGYDDITLHYARTLADWRSAFTAKLHAVRAQGFDEMFIRMWEFYLCYCEAGFAERRIHTGQFLLAKPEARSLPAMVLSR